MTEAVPRPVALLPGHVAGLPCTAPPTALPTLVVLGGVTCGCSATLRSCATLDRNRALLMLTPELLIGALALGAGVVEPSWAQRLRAWVRDRLGAPR